ncbi:MAG: glycosyltransferase family 9 protein [Pigmentiphaga sp.]|uniref:glycosyltransferase family 9 protein n=1 Tax=Pigmentiphaga sp. TaxID=1977564 RepID=UPI0029B2064C|nr:glycosyltransferase family 9 protein [Pigmentiphaga sp.]MDX3904353.1 glycosyltransferase family 9 protein [Pigmentiphaga sp.]
MPDTAPLYVRLPNWVGDACMCLPALHLLREAGSRLFLCGRPWARDLFAGFAAAGFVPLGSSFTENLRALRLADGVRGALGVVFPNSLSSAALFRLAGIRTAGYRGDGRSLLLDWPITKPDGLHEVEVFYRLARAALARWQPDRPNPGAAPRRLDLPLTEAHRRAADEALEQAGVQGPFVLLAPIATGLHHGRPKAWPHFGGLAQALQARGWTCVVCPPPHERQQTQEAVPTATVLPSLELGAFAALTQRAALVVCNDSGTSHVAAAAGARQITLFGVTRRERTGPWSPDAICLGSDGRWPALGEVVETSLGCVTPSAP